VAVLDDAFVVVALGRLGGGGAAVFGLGGGGLLLAAGGGGLGLSKLSKKSLEDAIFSQRVKLG